MLGLSGIDFASLAASVVELAMQTSQQAAAQLQSIGNMSFLVLIYPPAEPGRLHHWSIGSAHRLMRMQIKSFPGLLWHRISALLSLGEPLNVSHCVFGHSLSRLTTTNTDEWNNSVWCGIRRVYLDTELSFSR